MSNAVWPALVRGLTYTILRTPEFATIVQTAPNGASIRIAQRRNPIWHWQLTYDYLYGRFPSPNNTQAYAPYTDIDVLQGFFLARQAQFDDFLFTDPKNHAVGPALFGGLPNLQAQLQVVNDGAGTYYSPIQRNVGGAFWEDITDLNGAIAVYANGVLTTAYTLAGPGLALPGSSFLGLYLRWSSAPATPVTAQFAYYFRVRFESDTQDFEQFLDELYTIGGSGSKNGSGMLKLMSARPPTG